MTGSLLLRGMIAGLVAGLFAFGFARAFGEPPVERAIAFEAQMETSEHGHDAEEPEIVSRSTQAGLGLFTGIMAYSAAMGGVFSLVFAGLYGRASKLKPRTLSAVIGIAAYLAIVVVPWLKYPPNPPAIGNPETIGARTGLYLAMMLASVFGMGLAFAFSKQLQVRVSAWNAAILSGVAYIVFIMLVELLLPAINEVPENFPALTLYSFRTAAMGIQAIIWCITALLFGYLAETVLLRKSSNRGVSAVLAGR